MPDFFEVVISAELASQISSSFPEERGPDGSPSEYDFWSGPLAAAQVAFKDFYGLPEHNLVRFAVTFDAIFGPVAFYGYQTGARIATLVEFGFQPDYFDSLDDDPGE